MATTMERLESMVADGSLSKVDAATEMAFRLNANEPESVKQGWPLVTCIEQAAKRFDLTENDVLQVRLRFPESDHKEPGAVLVIRTSPTIFQVWPWPGGNLITAEKESESLFTRSGGVNWKAVGAVHPGRAEQFAKALAIAAKIAEGPVVTKEEIDTYYGR